MQYSSTDISSNGITTEMLINKEINLWLFVKNEFCFSFILILVNTEGNFTMEATNYELKICLLSVLSCRTLSHHVTIPLEYLIFIFGRSFEEIRGIPSLYHSHPEWKM